MPVLFLIENNGYSFSTPTSFQYACARLSDRAVGYGVTGRTIDGTDAWEVYTSVCDALETMQATLLPAILECMTLRLCGHAVYDKGDYMPAEQMRDWRARDPVPAARQKLLDLCGMSEAGVAAIEQKIDEELRGVGLGHAGQAARRGPAPDERVCRRGGLRRSGAAGSSTGETPVPRGSADETTLPPYCAAKVKNGDAVNSGVGLSPGSTIPWPFCLAWTWAHTGRHSRPARG